jgi:hypothetical protein
MKYSQTAGIIFSLCIIVLCFFPWTYIESQHLTITGFSTTGTTYGKPGLLNAILCTLMILLFAVPALWSKRTNVLLAALNLAWSFRNYLLLSFCMMGECPERKPALFGLLLSAIIVMVMALLPKIPFKKELPESD